jgi:hypothetical protein
MNLKNKMAEELMRKEERVNAWERQNSINEHPYEDLNVEYWYVEDW